MSFNAPVAAATTQDRLDGPARWRHPCAAAYRLGGVPWPCC